MPFQEINVQQKIKEKQKTNADFNNAWKDQNEKHLINQIIQIRDKQGITQKQLAKLLNKNQQMVSRFESKKHSPSLKTFVEVANKLGYDVILQKREE